MSPVLGATQGKVWSMDGILEMEYYRLQHHSIIVILDRSSLIIETRLKAHHREFGSRVWWQLALEVDLIDGTPHRICVLRRRLLVFHGLKLQDL